MEPGRSSREAADRKGESPTTMAGAVLDVEGAVILGRCVITGSTHGRVRVSSHGVRPCAGLAVRVQ
jgi:hypothetical protein